MAVDHGIGAGESVRKRLWRKLYTPEEYWNEKERRSDALLVLSRGMDEILHRLERIENGEKKTGSGTTPICGNTESGSDG